MYRVLIENEGGLTLAEIPCSYADAASIFYKIRVGISGCVRVVEYDELGEIVRVIAQKKGVRQVKR